MCFNKELSLALFSFGLAAAIKMFMKGANAAGIYLLALSSMQIVEFFIHMWPNPKSKVHQMASLMVIFVFVFQIATSIAVTYMRPDVDEKLRESTLGLGSILLLITVVCFFGLIMPKYGKFNSTPSCPQGCKLSWPVFTAISEYSFPLIVLIGAIHATLLLISTEVVFGWICTLLVGLALLASLVFSFQRFGSVWCAMVVFGSIFVILFDEKITPD
jgi:hypothetical protein